MYQIESIFIGENQVENSITKPTRSLETKNNNKVGDIIRLASNTFILNCVQCSQTFYHFPEFTLHIEDHFLQKDVLILTNSNGIDQTNGLKYNENASEEPEQSYQFNVEYETENDIYSTDFPKYENQNQSQTIQSESENTENTTNEQLTEEFEPVSDLSQLIEGVTYHKVNNKFECLTCGVKCTSKNNLKIHLSIHLKIKNIFCPICMKGFSSVHYAQKHIKSIHKQTISTTEIRKSQMTLKQIVKPKKSDGNNQPVDEVSKVKLNVLSSNYWRTEGKKYHCVLCVQWFAVPKYVQKHIRLVHGQHIPINDILAAQIQPELKPEPTKSVELVTQQQIQSLQREQLTSKRVKSFECFVCHTMFVQEKALRYHFPLHEGIQYQCPLCDKYFSMQKYVRDHMIYKHGFDKKSKLPPLKMRKIENFEYHKPVVSKFECYLCHRTYPSRSKLLSHMKSHIDIMECNICMKIFKSNESRRRHMQLHSADPSRLHHCLICNKAFAVRRYMMSHLRTSHTNPKVRNEKSPKIPQILTCEICQKVFDKQGTYNKHIKCHNKEPARYMCDCCGQAFESRHMLRRHLSTEHKISKKYVKCNLCQKIVPKKREEEHLKFHNGQKEHQCEICGNQYVTEGLLNRHKKQQHTGHKYDCDVCAESFDQSKKLLHHRRTHPQPMELHCSVCNLGFFNARSLNKHEMKKHIQTDIIFDSESDSDTIFNSNSDMNLIF